GTFTPWWNKRDSYPDHPITVYMSRRLEKSKQGRELKVINKLRNQGVESNGDSHPQFQDTQPVRLKRGTEGSEV
ncbi:hypothetical protein, partial [Limnospira sp. PMC 289.06]|uniref:hypothetical protein n=1 Tax=Limnospira sp. PMC 289.06 TaxID=2981094 RepID=UPI0028E0CC3A|nr:hypothetical protein [Limnospira sp. PMC 289.06]